MELKTYFAQDAAGNIISSAIVNVFLHGTTTLATGLTRADGTPLENPFAADGAGRIQFRAPDGYYDVQVSAGPGIIQTLTIQCVDYSEAKADADRADASAEQAQNALNSITGINTNFEQNSREQWRRSLAEAGLTLVSGSFEEGATANSKTDAVWHIAVGQCYSWDGEFTKIVPAGSTPESTGGVGPSAWVSVGDASLRSDLNKTAKSAVLMGLIADGVTNEKSTLENIKRESSEANAPVVVPMAGKVRSLMHDEPVDDLMPAQFVTLGNLKGRLDVYDPEPVPSWNKSVEGAANGTEIINADWLYAEFDKLVNASKGKLFRQEDIGTSQDGAYAIRQYLWVGANHPSNPSPDKSLREILVSAGVHGSETIGMLGLLYFMKDLIEHGDEIPALRWLYYNTRIRIVPVANPWGVSQTPKVRNNSRGVNLNRNFDYRWNELPPTQQGDAGHKGDAPFSESETKALRDWFKTFASASVAYVDLHNMGPYEGNSAKAPHFVGFCNPLSDSIANKIFTKFTNKHTRVEVINGQNDPTTTNYATVNFGLPSFTCEHTDTAWARDGSSYTQARDTSYSITGAVKMYGNVIAGFAKLATRQLFPVQISNDNASVVIPAGDKWTQLFERKSYESGIDGVIKIRAGVVIRNRGDKPTNVTLGIAGDSGSIDRKAVPYATVQAQSTSTLYIDNMFRVTKAQRKYPLSVHVASEATEVTVVRYYVIIEPMYLGYDVGSI